MTTRSHPSRRARTRLAPLLAALAAATVLPSLATVPADARPASGAASHGHHRTTPLVIGHRGASGYRPEHTLASYRLAIAQGADYIEPDLVSTRDGVLVARHENEIGGTTDVADHPEFADRRTTKTIDGRQVTGWFTEDFTYAELETLRAKERLPQVRPANTAYDGRYRIPTLQQVIDLARRESRRLHRTIGIAPETKHPTYFRSIGLPLEGRLVRTLERNHLDRRTSPVIIQSFEVGNLKRLHRMTPVPLVQLVDSSGAPYDAVAAGRPTTYADLITPAGLRGVARYATWLGADKTLLLQRDAEGRTGAPTPVIADAHRAGLRVVAYTLRAENQFLPPNHRVGTDPNAYGDLAGEATDLFRAGLDAVFADQPNLAVAARDAFVDGPRGRHPEHAGSTR
ncbi:glycerophosphodiester phosphodiesterase [Nocardioides sp. TRM66260-LWL]|uniref:glycerophosphodiester phosphodiesterase n=1 Tax=Nocardioides sp. TRM66260-LWL TaxID=2874478 RepID=UPI001CC5736C|nr:glycerophosphodiester phosphodiesterase [Nocardioides sp. TRM66260-LWL]MBZ5734756.1 glycerophosphodiester phosphodiesterase [Nocardioides sp. TRM66260-LWL]